jgi:hypothetical protein
MVVRQREHELLALGYTQATRQRAQQPVHAVERHRPPRVDDGVREMRLDAPPLARERRRPVVGEQRRERPRELRRVPG